MGGTERAGGTPPLAQAAAPKARPASTAGTATTFAATLARAETPAPHARLRDSGVAATSQSAALGRQPFAPVAEAAFQDRIALRESSAQRAGQGYGARNPSSGALGRYQITPQALRDLGWQDSGGHWTALAARHGVDSDASFLASPAAQETAMAAFLRRAEQQLDRNGSLERLGGAVTGLDGTAVPLTASGLVAAAHRRGAGSVARYLAHRTETPQAELSRADRRSFAAVEARLREFAEIPYTMATRTTRLA